jgi:hypothetical protein
MAETQRVASSPASARPALKPRPKHPPRHNPPLRPGLDETHDLRPPSAPPRPAKPTVAATTTPAAEALPAAPSPRRQLPPRSPAEWVILAVLAFGLGLNVVALLTASRLSRSDLLLGATVLFAGVVLLILIEVCRRSAPPPAGEAD